MEAVTFIPRKLKWVEYIDSFSNWNIDNDVRSEID